MARLKQTARKSTGGMAPRRQLSTIEDDGTCIGSTPSPMADTPSPSGSPSGSQADGSTHEGVDDEAGPTPKADDAAAAPAGSACARSPPTAATTKPSSRGGESTALRRLKKNPAAAATSAADAAADGFDDLALLTDDSSPVAASGPPPHSAAGKASGMRRLTKNDAAPSAPAFDDLEMLGDC